MDAAPAINRAVAAAGERGGGTVTIPPGTYRIGDVIRIGHSNVVLRGAGSGRTKLVATKNLTELIGPYVSRYGGDKSSWSWTGGLAALRLPSARRAVSPDSSSCCASPTTPRTRCWSTWPAAGRAPRRTSGTTRPS